MSDVKKQSNFNGKIRMAIDIGFGYVKAVREDNIQIFFPSVVSKQVENSLKGYIGSNADDYSVIYWETDENGKEINQKKCYVGDAAITNGGTRQWEDKQFNMDEMKILISTAVAALMSDITTFNRIDLAVGLPMSYYLSKKDELIKELKSIKAKVSVNGINKLTDVKFSSVECFPQGAGAYFASFMDLNGSVTNIDVARSSVGVIDIGYRTVDYLVMGRGRKGITVIDNLTGSLEEDGMNKAFQSIQKSVSELPQVQHEVPLIDIETAILWDKDIFRFRQNKINLGEIKEKAYKEQAEKIASKIKIKWGVQGETLPYIFITGGGGKSLFNILKTKFEQAELQNDSMYANCLGFLGAQARSMNQ